MYDGDCVAGCSGFFLVVDVSRISAQFRMNVANFGIVSLGW